MMLSMVNIRNGTQGMGRGASRPKRGLLLKGVEVGRALYGGALVILVFFSLRPLGWLSHSAFATEPPSPTLFLLFIIGLV